MLRDIEDPDVLTIPDLVIEIVETSWKVNKLDIYSGLGVPEVWSWKAALPEIHVLESAAYELRPQSSLLPNLDLALLSQFSDRPDQGNAVREYGARVREAVAR